MLAWPWFSWCVEHDQPLPLDTKGRIRVAVDVRGGYLDIITLLEAKNVHQEMLCIVRRNGRVALAQRFQHAPNSEEIWCTQGACGARFDIFPRPAPNAVGASQRIACS